MALAPITIGLHFWVMVATVPVHARLDRLFPVQLPAGPRERALGIVGTAVGVLLTALLCGHWLPDALPFALPLAASAVLLFVTPSSPLAQPWAVIGGNTVSALVGVCLRLVFGHNYLVAALAMGLAALFMHLLRCIHPPGGAMAVTAVVGGPVIVSQGLGFVVHPVLLNSLVMVMVATGFHALSGRRYPAEARSRANPHQTRDALPMDRHGIGSDDVMRALKERGEPLDVAIDDLVEVIRLAEAQAHQRRYGAMTCADVMSRDVVSVGWDVTAKEAWEALSRHRIKVLPVVDEFRRVCGVVSLHDFFIDHLQQARSTPWEELTVSSIMSTRLRVAYPQTPLTDLVGLFSDQGFHHLPVVDQQGRLEGMLTQSDVLAALYQRMVDRV